MDTVTIKIDDKGRGTLRRFARPGQVYLAESPEPGQITLRLMAPKKFSGQLELDADGLPVWRCEPVNVADLIRQVRDEI